MFWRVLFRYLVWTSLLGDIAVTAGIFGVIIYGFVEESIHSPFDLPAFNADTFSKFFGMSVFLFAVHVVVVPISQSMAVVEHFPKVVNWSFTVIVILNTMFGTLGYMLYGDDTENLVIDNVKGPVATVIKIMLSVDLFFTVPIVLCAPRELCENALLPHLPTRIVPTWVWQNIIRTSLVIIFTLLAIAVPDLGDLATLVGGFVSPFMGFIMPCVFHFHFNSSTMSGVSKSIHGAIIIFGVFAGIFTTYQQIYDMATK